MANNKTKATAHQDLRSMGQDYMERLDALLVRGVSTPKLAVKIQQDWELLQHIKTDTLAKKILRYKNSELDYKLQTQVLTTTKVESNGTVTILKKLVVDPQAKVVVQDEIENLINLQMQRVQKLYKVEENMPTLTNQMRLEIKELRDMLKDLATLQMDLGILKRVPKEIKASMGLTPEDLDQERLLLQSEELNEQQDRAMSEVLLALSTLIDEDVQDGEYD